MNKQDKANFLFEEIGGIDESILHDCGEMFPTKRREKSLTLRIMSAMVAVLSLFVMAISGVGIASVITIITSLGDLGNGTAPPTTVLPSESEGNIQPDSEIFTTDILFCGTPSLIYIDEEETLRAVKISSIDLYEIDRLSAAPKRKVTANNTPSDPVWVSSGTGKVFTPYLENTPGNTYYGQIFDYTDEVVPNDQLSNLLDQLLP